MTTALRRMPGMGSMPAFGRTLEAARGFDIVLPSDPAVLSNSPIAVMLFNRRGQGKTTLIVYLAMFQKERHLHHGRKCAIWANFHMHMADRQDGYLCEKIMGYDPELIDELMDDRIYKLVCIDEIQKMFPSIRGSSNYNQEFRRFLEDIRKTNTELVVATQHAHLLDSGLLVQIDLMCKPYLRRGPKPGHAYSFVEVWDYWGNWTGIDRRKWWPPQPYDIDWTLTIPNVHLAWPHFSSKEIIPPAWVRFRERLLEHQGFEVMAGKNGDKEQVAAAPWSTAEEKPPTEEEFLEGLRQQKAVFINEGVIQAIRRITKRGNLGLPGVSRYLERAGARLTEVEGVPFATWGQT